MAMWCRAVVQCGTGERALGWGVKPGDERETLGCLAAPRGKGHRHNNAEVRGRLRAASQPREWGLFLNVSKEGGKHHRNITTIRARSRERARESRHGFFGPGCGGVATRRCGGTLALTVCCRNRPPVTRALTPCQNTGAWSGISVISAPSRDPCALVSTGARMHSTTVLARDRPHSCEAKGRLYLSRHSETELSNRDKLAMSALAGEVRKESGIDSDA
ncbi:hypothetical protein AAFF_G00226670 [Aldrovandia affinis]|uniref:Uncharacterized protein n=1 Tax=Aldrovandia affinis TaxID=143900 RepID=A0AAD7X3B4_9TELE|nr:hypothetical protein AAFF_G00226670 [Aldrovandia affinis]